jgi:DNA polymerase-3 subunit gamma/tau
MVAAFGGYRVYILDEAHMLSTAAWNALLKTLEEPPAGTIFVLCTTETRKVPATVISRCQHVRFQAPTTKQIAQRIRVVAGRENIVIDDGGVTLLARASRGSYRDALQLLQQAQGRGPEGGEITETLVRTLLGSEDESQLFAALKAVGDADLAGALSAGAQLGADNDAETVLRDLEQLARDILVCGALGKIPPSLQTTPARDDLITLSSNSLGAVGAARLLDEIGNALLAVRAGADPRVRLELALAKAADPKLSPPGDEQTARRLDRVEATVMSQQRSRRPVGQ